MTNAVYVYVVAERAGGTQNGVHFSADNRQRLLAEEAELDRMVKELQATLPPSEGEPVCSAVSVAGCVATTTTITVTTKTKRQS